MLLRTLSVLGEPGRPPWWDKASTWIFFHTGPTRKVSSGKKKSGEGGVEVLLLKKKGDLKFLKTILLCNQVSTKDLSKEMPTSDLLSGSTLGSLQRAH